MFDRTHGNPGDDVGEPRSLDMDAVTAHLDRGWDLLARGDLSGARVSANHILQHDADSPEGYALLGAIAREEGDAEEAIELFQKALDADPEYVDAMLQAADVAIHDLGDASRGLRLCDEAEELLEPDEEEATEVWLLRAEAMMLGGDMDAARRPIDAVAARRRFTDPRMYLRAGRLMVDAGRIDAAVDYLERALEYEPAALDGHYFLGLALDGADPRRALAHLYEAHRLDGEVALPPWLPPLEEIESIAREVIEELGEPLGPTLGKVPLRVAEQPPLELIAEGNDPRMLIYLAGIPAQLDEAAAAIVAASKAAGVAATVVAGTAATAAGSAASKAKASGAKAKKGRAADVGGKRVGAGSDPRLGRAGAAGRGSSPAIARAVEGDGELEPELFAIFIYRRSIAYWAPAGADIKREIARALIVEGAFFLGLDDKTIDELLERCEAGDDDSLEPGDDDLEPRDDGALERSADGGAGPAGDGSE